jgi:hypothetical protein
LALVGLMLAALTAAPPVQAWGTTGHMLTAQIAYSTLSPQARAEADRLIAVLATADPRTPHFVPAAVWMDEVRGSGLRAMDTWHYINLPINAGGLAEVPAALQTNVVWAIDQAAATLADPEATDFERAFTLRILLHVVGDVHQPLHCVGRFTEALPKGDRGGNLFFIQPVEEGAPDQLHWLWDATVGLYPRIDEESDWQQPIAALAEQIMASHPLPVLPVWRRGIAEEWAREGFELAHTAVYDGVAEGAPVTREYVARAWAVIPERLALAGYRLAQILEATLLPQPVAADPAAPETVSEESE